MATFVDLSHVIEDGMPGIRLRRPDGTMQEGTARVRSWLSREAMSKLLQGEASFEVTELQLPTAIGTYIDSPFNRYPDGRDISELGLDDLIMTGIVVDVRGQPLGQPVPADAVAGSLDVKGAAVLFNFGWDRHWGADSGDTYPYIAPELADSLADRGARLLGFDTGNADGPDVPAHPVHTRMLARGVLIVENLMNLDALHGKRFRFFAIPLKARRAASMPLRAFAEIF
jgi:kynurenine formamidase